MIIEINALDTLFFRDGKPFSMGEETWANGIFPPYPSVIYGALRSAYFSNHIDELEKANQKGDRTKDLRINGIFLKIKDEVCFPLPLDCVKEKDNDKNESFILSSKPTGNLISNYPKLEKILIYPNNDKNNKIENISNAILVKIDFEDYLNSNADNIFYYKLNKFLLSEPKIGIARASNTHSTEEGKLYRVDMKRLADRNKNNLSIIVEFEGLELPDSGFLKLGGEGKAAIYKKYNKSIKVNLPKFEDDKRFKIILVTPAIFNNGCLPNWIDKNNFVDRYDGINLKLLTVAIGKPISIGGFDMKKKEPKPMYKAVPAGSVYYFKLIEGNMKEVKKAFHQKAISDIYPEQGFGIAYAGKVINPDGGSSK